MNHQEFANEISNYTILYIEDDYNIRKYILEFLSRYCPNIYTCSSSEEGYELYKKYRPNILLLDINLPGISGIDFASLIREEDEDIRIIISTAYTNAEFTIKAVELDLCRYLVKPVTNDDLISAFKKALSKLNRFNIFNLGDGYFYDKRTTSIKFGANSITLRKKESEILEFFIENEGKVLRYDILENEVWSNGLMTRDAIRSQIRNIRKKIKVDCIKNIVGVGYKFEVVS